MMEMTTLSMIVIWIMFVLCLRSYMALGAITEEIERLEYTLLSLHLQLRFYPFGYSTN